jgi:hypothetical protein
MIIYSTNNGSDMRRAPEGADTVQLERDGRTVIVVGEVGA